MRPQPVLMEAETATGHREGPEAGWGRGCGLQSWGWGWVRAEQTDTASVCHWSRADNMSSDWLSRELSASTINEDTRTLAWPALCGRVSASIRSLNWVRGSQPIRELWWVIHGQWTHWRMRGRIEGAAITLERINGNIHAMQNCIYCIVTCSPIQLISQTIVILQQKYFHIKINFDFNVWSVTIRSQINIFHLSWIVEKMPHRIDFSTD